MTHSSVPISLTTLSIYGQESACIKDDNCIQILRNMHAREVGKCTFQCGTPMVLHKNYFLDGKT